ncbi:MAG TPA: TRAP transporter fused permease subunit [Vicinamibacterales bacterium]|nr:TRAP transporter fused permease subunit [Vicinamibacterales bacterium]
MAAVTGWRERAGDVLAFALAAYALYWVVGIVDPQIYRVSFLLIALAATFLIYPLTSKRLPAAVRHTVDGLCIVLTVIALAWPIVDFDAFVLRAATPTTVDLVLGAIATLLVLDATRRTTGWILPVTAVIFLAYAYFGSLLDQAGLSLIAHRGYSLSRILGTLYMTLEGIFGVPLDVTATYIVLFTIYGAVLEYSGAGRFFIDWAASTVGRTRSGSGAGRTVTVAGYLLGAVSGSGVANTVMLGAVAWPMMRRAGYPPDTGGAMLAASGIGAILAPPAMGAAAFLIAEYLKITYLEVIAMAAVPALLYYLSVFLMVEGDSRRLAVREIDVAVPSPWAVTKQGWHHFGSLVAIVVLMTRGLTAFRAVFWATVLAVAASFLRRETALVPRRLGRALAAGARSVLPVAATTATAGIIVGVVTLTGLGLKVAGVIVSLAAGNVILTAVYAALAVWVLGLAVPVTASYIISAVMIAPALTSVGIPAAAAHMFIFYYAVLSEVSPPTALSPFAAAAITGGNPFRTTMISWKYVVPAFVVPFVFTLSPGGSGVLLQGSVVHIVSTSAAAVLGTAALSIGISGWLRRQATVGERCLLVAAAVLLFLPQTTARLAGVACATIAMLKQSRSV